MSAIPTPATTLLAKAIRASASDNTTGSEQAELLRCFARILEGKDLDKAMGAPGDWGYDTPIGDAVLALIREPGESPRLMIPTEKGGA